MGPFGYVEVRIGQPLGVTRLVMKRPPPLGRRPFGRLFRLAAGTARPGLLRRALANLDPLRSAERSGALAPEVFARPFCRSGDRPRGRNRAGSRGRRPRGWGDGPRGCRRRGGLGGRGGFRGRCHYLGCRPPGRRLPGRLLRRASRGRSPLGRASLGCRTLRPAPLSLRPRPPGSGLLGRRLLCGLFLLRRHYLHPPCCQPLMGSLARFSRLYARMMSTYAACYNIASPQRQAARAPCGVG